MEGFENLQRKEAIINRKLQSPFERCNLPKLSPSLSKYIPETQV